MRSAASQDLKRVDRDLVVAVRIRARIGHYLRAS
jgi:hypothetical protein